MRGPRSLLVLALLIALALAGCSGKPSPTTSGTGGHSGNGGNGGGNGGNGGGNGGNGGTANPNAPEVFRLNGTINAGVNAGVSFTQGATPLDFTVANGTLLYVEMQWTSPAMFDLNLCLHGPKTPDIQGVPGCEDTKDGGMVGSPDSPFHYTRQKPDDGAWSASATSGNGGAANTNYEIAVTVFHGETTVPAGYSGL